MNGQFTKTEQKILAVLADGNPHYIKDMIEIVFESTDEKLEESYRNQLRFHVFNIRKRLRPRGEDLICEYANRRTHYRHVRLIARDR